MGKLFEGGGELHNYKKFMFQLIRANEGNTIWQAPNKAPIRPAGGCKKTSWESSLALVWYHIQNGSATLDIVAGVGN